MVICPVSAANGSGLFTYSTKTLDNPRFSKYTPTMDVEIKERTSLINARVGFAKSRMDAAERAGCTDEWIRLVEKGSVTGVGANKCIILLCKWYMMLAYDDGYEQSQFHQAVLCPDDFPAALAIKTEDVTDV